MSLGPGFVEHMTPRALAALADAEVVVGYRTYLDLVSELIQGKRTVASGMRKEVARCRAAIDEALSGRRVALISSGDAGIYGMAGLVFDICRERGVAVIPASADNDREPEDRAPEPAEGDGVPLRVEVIPGVAAFNAAAARLGAPLMHDFAAVSLSDHLTPWPVIAGRLEAAAQADFVLAIYNPRSGSRPHRLSEARDILLRHRPAETPVGLVQRAMRDGEARRLATLGTLPVEWVDMQTVVLVGNSRTYVWNDWMVTPRGYLDKYDVE